MIPKYLKLKGAIGVNRSLGLDEISVDFTSFKPGVIAITGRNGSGKTTLLENMTPYRALLSRSGSLYGHFEGPSLREYSFMFDAAEYICRIEIDPEHRQQRARIIKNGVPLNDGTAETYDAEVEKIFGPISLFRNTIFSAQNAVKIGGLSKADKKDLFIELLNLSIYADFEDYAKGRFDNFMGQASSFSLQINSLTQKIATETIDPKVVEQQKLTIQQTTVSLEQSKKDRQELDTQLQQLKIEYVTLQQQAEALQNANIAVLEARKRLADAQSQMNTQLTRLTTKQNTLRADQALQARAAAELDSAKKTLTTYQQWKVYHQQLLDQDKIAQSLEREATAVKAQLDIGTQSLQRFIRDLKETLKAEQASGIPCTPIDAQLKFSCPIFSKYLQTPSPVLYQQIEQQNLQLDKLHAELEKLLTEKTKVFVDPAKLKEATVNAANTEQATAHFTRCQNAAENLSRISKELEEVKQLHASEKERFEMQVVSETLAQQEKLAAYNELLPKVKDTSNLEKAIKGQENQLSQLGAQIKTLEENLIFLHRALATLEAKQVEIEQAKKSVVELKTQLDSTNYEAGDWKLLTRAFNRSGIPTLEISQAGPEVTTIANELLTECFDTNFTIEFVTLMPTVKGDKYKEVFEILVHRDREVVSVDNLSGGEQVFVQQALVEALGVYSRLYSSRKWQTSFCDESDSPLDSINRISYYKMREKVHQLCKLVYTLYITHDVTVLNIIPQRINLSKEKGVVIEN